ncbi:hypothetical protein BG52_05745 [Paenibacillus darwinianus]|nr:hypothetical protein BG52_05745 [Paenibacillus darwinianus]
MKKAAFKRIVAVLLIGAGMWSGSHLISQAVSDTPGSVDDPVVTKSYVDKLLGSGGGSGDSARKELQAMMDAFKKEMEANKAGTSSEVVIVKPGQTLMASAGAQFVLRAGKGVAYSSDVNGISNVTAGTDIKSGNAVPNNHLIIFPREGRGVMPDPDQTGPLTVLVLGGYELK